MKRRAAHKGYPCATPWWRVGFALLGGVLVSLATDTPASAVAIAGATSPTMAGSDGEEQMHAQSRRSSPPRFESNRPRNRLNRPGRLLERPRPGPLGSAETPRADPPPNPYEQRSEPAQHDSRFLRHRVYQGDDQRPRTMFEGGELRDTPAKQKLLAPRPTPSVSSSGD